MTNQEQTTKFYSTNRSPDPFPVDDDGRFPEIIHNHFNGLSLRGQAHCTVKVESRFGPKFKISARAYALPSGSVGYSIREEPAFKGGKDLGLHYWVDFTFTAKDIDSVIALKEEISKLHPELGKKSEECCFGPFGAKVDSKA